MQYLENRFIKLDIKGVSKKRLINKGTPQGGVLSPLVWNIAFDRLLEQGNSGPQRMSGVADESRSEERIPARREVWFVGGISAIVFGLAHLTNYSTIEASTWILPGIVLSQIVGGFFILLYSNFVL